MGWVGGWGALVGFDVTVDEAFGVCVCDALNQLVCQHQHRFEREFAVAERKEVLKAGAEQVHHLWRGRPQQGG